MASAGTITMGIMSIILEILTTFLYYYLILVDDHDPKFDYLLLFVISVSVIIRILLVILTTKYWGILI